MREAQKGTAELWLRLYKVVVVGGRGGGGSRRGNDLEVASRVVVSTKGKGGFVRGETGSISMRWFGGLQLGEHRWM